MFKHIPPLFFTSLILLTITGCKARLDADFEADTVGDIPNEMPAGPEDDRVYVLEFPGRGTALVTNSSPLSGSKSLRLSGPGGNLAGGVYSTTVYMYSELLEYNEPVYASWLGKLSAGAATKWVVSDGHFDTLVEIELRNGQFRVNGALAGNYTAGQKHAVIISMQRNGRFGATISGSGASGSVSNRPLLSTLDSTSIQLAARLEGGNAASYYIMDDVNISEDEPD